MIALEPEVMEYVTVSFGSWTISEDAPEEAKKKFREFLDKLDEYNKLKG